MRYELIADRYAAHLEAEVIEEGLPMLLIMGSLLAYAGINVAKNGIDPEWQKLAEESTWYNVISIFDPTGIMSWPYVPYALEKYEQDDSWWNGFILLLACFSTVPVMGLGARLITRVLTFPVRLPFKILAGAQSLFKSIGARLSRNKRITEEIVPDILAKASQTNYKGKNLGASMRKALERTFGIRVTDDAIAKSSSKLGIKSALAKGGRMAVTGAKTGGRIARTAMAINMMQDNKISDQIKKALNTPRTPAVYGPKVGFGQIGGKIQYGPPSN